MMETYQPIQNFEKGIMEEASDDEENFFSLTYGSEAMIHVEVDFRSFHIYRFDPANNEVNHCLYLDMIPKTRADSEARLALYH